MQRQSTSILAEEWTRTGLYPKSFLISLTAPVWTKATMYIGSVDLRQMNKEDHSDQLCSSSHCKPKFSSNRSSHGERDLGRRKILSPLLLGNPLIMCPSTLMATQYNGIFSSPISESTDIVKD